MVSVKTTNTTLSNVVSKKELREVQQWTLQKLKEAVEPSAGPYGSTTQILKIDPNSVGKQNALMEATEYTKDGHTILSHVRFNKAIEDSLQKEITDLTRHIVKKVGDGTTSVTILSSLIFDELLKLDEDKYPPYLIIETFQNVVDNIKDIIKSNTREMTEEDAYDIAMICTNSNKRVANIISKIYKDYGKDVFIDVGASNGNEDVIKTYDGLTLDVGFSDTCYINTVANSNKFVLDPNDIENVHGESIIRNASIYAFTDPIDTVEMQQLFDAVIFNNIIEPFKNMQKSKDPKDFEKLVPTVIMAPKISLDMSSTFDEIVAFMHNFDQNLDVKPPLLIITNINEINYETYSDIWRLAGCKPIKKYIDPEIQKKDIADGKAPTPKTICKDFCGHADEVKSDSLKTSIVNPSDMFKKDDKGEFVLDENGQRVYSDAYITQVSFLEQELQNAINNGEDYDVTGNLRRRVHALKSNMVDYYVGGVTVTDRDSVRALTEDAVKNIRSASKYGVGYGANFEGLRASDKYYRNIVNDDNIDDLTKELARCIINAYHHISTLLYNTVYYPDINAEDKENYINKLIDKSLEVGCPMNFKTKEFNKDVLCTIEQDIIILDTIAKIITIIFTTNQALTQTVAHNMYMDLDKIDM